ncbi:MAG TPA: hypothetical protein VMT46_17110 [Anaerolineaceae bacterium]|nr:hypothetical protein [Anaerolineaceae bacterium]
MRRFCFLISVIFSLTLGFFQGPVTTVAAEPECRHKVYLPLVAQGPVAAPPDTQSPLEQLTNQVADGQADVVRGVYVAGILALPVIQQPANSPYYVESRPGVATQFEMASSFQVIGLLAHNDLAGSEFFQLQAGEEVDIVYGDGQIARFHVSRIDQYQALDPTSTSSRFVDLATDENVSAADVFVREYTTAGQVTFQTCITRDGIPSWGRLFVIAEPAS